MFGNLIESRSHTSEFARRGYFLALTALGYGVLVMAGTVASVYAYDASLEVQQMDLVSMVTPLPIPAVQPARQPQKQPAQHQTVQVQQRTVAIAPIADSIKPPETVSTTPSTVPPMLPGPVVIGPRNLDPPASGTGPVGNATGNQVAENHPVLVDVEKPPVVPPVEKKPLVISKGPITGQAISLPKPAYPQIAVQVHAQGAVRIQVLIDENGKVISAQVLDGHPLLRQSALQAAWQARFNPTTLGGTPVKVSGYIVYNFNRN